MRDPKIFANPSELIPDRFMKDGHFENDPKVCGFSVGRRKKNCIGKSPAIEEYFTFATTIVENFKLIRLISLETRNLRNILLFKFQKMIFAFNLSAENKKFKRN